MMRRAHSSVKSSRRRRLERWQWDWRLQLCVRGKQGEGGAGVREGLQQGYEQPSTQAGAMGVGPAVAVARERGERCSRA